MEKMIEELIVKVKYTIQNPTEIESLSRWADEKHHFMYKQGYNTFLRYRLILDILLRLRDINDPLLDDWEWGYTESKRSVYIEELNEIYEFLVGKRNFVEVMIVQENILEAKIKYVEEIYFLANKVLDDQCLSAFEVDQLEHWISSFTIQTRGHCIVHEMGLTALHLHDALRHQQNKIISIGNIGGSTTISVNDEKIRLQHLKKIIEGISSYRLNLCLNKQDIYYNSITII